MLTKLPTNIAYKSCQVSQLAQRDREHREIEASGGLQVGEHLLAAFQRAFVLRFPLFDKRARYFQLGAYFQNQAGKPSLQAGDFISERRFGQSLPVAVGG